MKKTKEKYELPEICYEEPRPGHPANPFPFISVKKDKTMPNVIFLEERKETGEQEMDAEGNPVDIIDVLMHKFVNMEVLKERLPPHLNDLVRECLGMKPLKEAQRSGQEILDRIIENVNSTTTKA